MPGITAALGCAAEAGLPLTFRKEATRLSIVTAQYGGRRRQDRLVGSGSRDTTVAVYMGLAAAAAVRNGLIGAGRDPRTPVAVLARGTRPDSRRRPRHARRNCRRWPRRPARGRPARDRRRGRAFAPWKAAQIAASIARGRRMTAPQQQKLKIKGPVVDHRQPARRRRRGLSHGRRQLDDASSTRPLSSPPTPARDRASDGRESPTTSRRSAPMSRRCRYRRSRRVQPGNLRERIRLRRPDLRAAGPALRISACIVYDDFDRTLVAERVARISRSGGAPAVRRTDRGRVQAAAADERRLSAAARLYAADRHSLRHAVIGPVAHACACRAPLRSRLRPFHHAAEHPVQLDQARRTAGRDGRSRAKPACTACRPAAIACATSRPINGPASRPTRSRTRASGRRSCASISTLHPEFSFLPRKFKIAVTAADARPRRHPRARHRPAAAPQRRGRGRLRGDGRRRARPHAVHRQDHQAVPAQARSAELCRGGPARLQPVRPARQYLQGAHQDPGA